MTDIIVIVGSCFLLYHLENGGGLFEIGRPSSRGGRILDLVGQAGGGGGGLENFTNFMDVIYVSSLSMHLIKLTFLSKKSEFRATSS